MIKSRDYDPKAEAERGHAAALFSRTRLARQQTGFERFVAVLLLLVSLIGSILAGGGGVARWLALTPIGWGAIAAGIVQCLLSYVQYIYAARWRSWQYGGAVLLSSALTIAGYWPLAWPWLVDILEAAQLPTLTAQIVAGLLLGLAALGVDIFPEKTLLG